MLGENALHALFLLEDLANYPLTSLLLDQRQSLWEMMEVVCAFVCYVVKFKGKGIRPSTLHSLSVAVHNLFVYQTALSNNFKTNVETSY